MSELARVCIHVLSQYVESQSLPDEDRYVFAYTITIRNLGRNSVQLHSRYWLITNGNGRETEVQGKVWLASNRTLPLAVSISTPAVRFLKPQWAPCKVTM